MAKCKYCNEENLKWNKTPNGFFRLQYPDGSAHRCQIDKQVHEQTQQQQQQQQQADRNLVNPLTISNIDAIKKRLDSIEERQNKLTELYNDTMAYLLEGTQAAKACEAWGKRVIENIEEINNLLVMYVSGKEGQQQQQPTAADKEFQYDQDKEDGLV